MFVKIVSLKKIAVDNYVVDQTRVFECQEYVKSYHDEGKTLRLGISLLNGKFIDNEISNPVNVFIENSRGDTIGRIDFIPGSPELEGTAKPSKEKPELTPEPSDGVDAAI